MAETAVALGREQRPQLDVEIEEGIEPDAYAGVQQLQQQRRYLQIKLLHSLNLMQQQKQ